MPILNPNEFVILNVDDSDAARYAKSRVLTRAGFHVIEASNGDDALTRAQKEQPDLILLDTKLPDTNGFEVCRKLKESSQTQSILVLQTSASYIKTSDKISAIECGADNYLFEPIEPEELVANVKALLRLGRAEQDLRLLNRRKDEFLATLAHELRNPLGPIRNAVEILRMLDPEVPPAQENARQIILRQTTHMVRLIDDLLDMSRISQGKINLRLETIELRSFVNSALETASDFILKHKHNLNINLPGDSIWVYGDTVRLSQVISNLLHNAAKFTPPGGFITLSAEKIGEQLVITVADTGIGISVKNLKLIFELFVQDNPASTPVQDGLGIGLALVQKLTELHNGTITAASAGAGKGSRFELRLPIVDAQKKVISAVLKTPTAFTALRILVIDDNEDSANSLAKLLQLFGHEVKTAYRGLECEEQIKLFHPNLVFLDIGLPDISGYEVAKIIRRNFSTKLIMLIALTGYGRNEDKALAIEAGFDEHFVKPLDLKKLESLGLKRSV